MVGLMAGPTTILTTPTTTPTMAVSVLRTAAQSRLRNGDGTRLRRRLRNERGPLRNRHARPTAHSKLRNRQSLRNRPVPVGS